jgi:hypothetical protein
MLPQLQVYKQVKHNSKHSMSAAASLQVSKFRIMQQQSIQYQQPPL